ncbi:uncharacterized protein C3orf62 homolog [Heteronotia binoei]|uniref:uncharacterized protein C3orf62 homolog n=1 Tax=Heteronotia binoei TaxID=13085 RepID=UPI00292E7763|nr:uncharacterized protein C3orf62 homolog [Heteronotia binoei]
MGIYIHKDTQKKKENGVENGFQYLQLSRTFKAPVDQADDIFTNQKFLSNCCFILLLSCCWNNSIKGEMSEKLSRCRKELTAAIDRALEELSVPLPDSSDSTTNLTFDFLTVEALTASNEDLVSHKGEPIACFPQQPLSDSSVPEKENPLKPNFTLLITTSNTPSKREPLISKENTCLHPPVLTTDRQFLTGKIDERPVKPDTSVTAADIPLECPKDLTDMDGNTAVCPAEKVQRKADLDELQQISRLSRELMPPDEASAFAQETRSSFRRVLENSPEDEEIIETLLDMEEDYRLNSSILHQP